MSTIDTKLNELLKCANSPEYFIANYCYIQHPTKGKVKFDMFDYQKELLNIYNNNRFSIANLARQTGKSTCAAAYLLWFAMYKPDSNILVATHAFGCSRELMQRIRFTYENLPDNIKSGIVADNKSEIEFDNGSRILFSNTKSDTGRGLSLSLIYLDEFASVETKTAKEFWASISPTLIDDGKCIIASTPNQNDEQFSKIWSQAESGTNDFKSILVKWNKHPDRDEKWAKNEEAKIGKETFSREHNCEFIA